MAERATLPTRPPINLPGRSLRARWRVYMILGLNLLVALVALCATLILVLEQQHALRRLHETAAAEARALVHSTGSTPGTSANTAPDEALLAALLGDTGAVFLVDDAGQVIAPQARTPASAAALDVFGESRNGGGAMRIYDGLSGEWVVGRAEHVPAAGVTIITETPLTDLQTLVVRGVALWVLALAITALVGEWLIRRILRTVLGPLEQLRDGAQAVAQQDYTYRVRLPPHTERELAQLGNSFNEMVNRLHASQLQIDAYTHHMEEIVDLRARELSRKALQLEVAAEVSSKIATILDPRDLVEEVVELIQTQFSMYHVAVLLVDEASKMLKTGERESRATLPPVSIRDGARSIVAATASSAQTIYVPDITADARYRHLPGYPASQSELAIPLTYHGRVIGVLNLEAEHRDAFRADDIAVLETLAHEIAAALHNAQTFAALERANRDLAQASLQARQANLLKSRFLLNTSHKLRTPLNAIIGYSETMLSGVYGDLSEQAADRQQRILENGRLLQALIEDMLDLSSIETGDMQLQLAWTPLPPLLDEVMNAARALHQTAHADHDLRLRLELDGSSDPASDLPPVWVDADRMRYILMSLMSNAIKYTRQGDVVLSAEATPEHVLIHVRDTGSGIRDDDLHYLFDAFQHPRGSTESMGKGTGLGLAVSRLLAMRHGGDIQVNSVLNQGSTFSVRLPRHPDAAPPPP